LHYAIRSVFSAKTGKLSSIITALDLPLTQMLSLYIPSEFMKF